MKTILQMYPSMPVSSDEERVRLRPIGRDAARFSRTIDGLVPIVKTADELGYWGMTFIEHHFHSEGFEVGPCPGIMNAWLGGYCKQMRMGQLGYVMSTQHPLRVAEETAVLDHILKGRFFVGFARGYQSRWVRTMGQSYDATATVGRETAQAAEADDRNQRIFREMVDIVVKAWTEASFSYNGEFFKVPYPYEGIDDYPAYPCSQRYGAPGEIDELNRVRRVSVVPAPYQKPHPPVFVSSSQSEESAAWTGGRGFNCGYFAPADTSIKQEKAFREGAARAGRILQPGQNQALLRFVVIGKTRDDAHEKVMKYIVPPFEQFYRYFFPRFFEAPGKSSYEQVMGTGLLMTGTVDDIKRQVAEVYNRVPFEYFSIVSHYALEPEESFIEDIDLFARKVAPEFT
jgi:alkanesulfonate monooxygenase SsuD/methylene tetrahydromethanopterin reductase-like flavin-dependent oxidoreductase (luciferase family)